MPDEDDETQRSFLRQRRNLFLISLVLATIQLTGATIGKELTLLGLKISLEDPGVLFYVLWGLWVYWVYRYYVYHRELMPLGFRDAIEARRIVELKNLARQRAAREIEDDQTSDEDEKLPPGKFTFREAADAPDYEYGKTTCELLSGGAAYKLAASLAVHFESVSKGSDYKSFDSGPETREYTWTRSSPEVKKASRRAWRWVLSNTHYLTEYGTPYLVASVPLAIEVVQFAETWLACLWR
jgi:hypothetical protein